MVLCNIMYASLSWKQMSFLRRENLKWIWKSKWFIRRHYQWSDSPRQGIYNFEWELHIQPNAQRRWLQTILPSNDRRDPGTRTEGALDTNAKKRNSSRYQNDYGNMVFQTQAISRWQPKQAQGKIMRTWWTTNMGSRLLGHVRSCRNVGKCQNATHSCKDTQARIKEYWFRTCLSSSWSGRTCVHGTTSRCDTTRSWRHQSKTICASTE